MMLYDTGSIIYCSLAYSLVHSVLAFMYFLTSELAAAENDTSTLSYMESVSLENSSGIISESTFTLGNARQSSTVISHDTLTLGNSNVTEKILYYETPEGTDAYYYADVTDSGINISSTMLQYGVGYKLEELKETDTILYNSRNRSLPGSMTVFKSDLENQYAFRDLICFECEGNRCPQHRFYGHLDQLITGCQACYKEWHNEMETAIRRCYKPEDLIELDMDNSTNTQLCGEIENEERTSIYCFCYADYCNHSITHHIVFTKTAVFMIILLLLL